MADDDGDIPDDLPAADGLWTQAHLEAPFTAYSIQQSYVRNPGITLSPVAGPPGTPADVIQVCAPYGAKVVSWTACRIGLRPLVPDSAPNIDNHVLAHEVVTTHEPVTSEDGQTKLFVISGTYVYLNLLPLVPASDGLAMGAPPYDRTPGASNVLGPEWYTKNILTGDTQPNGIKNIKG